jgi:arylsulfatase A-like enzyme
MTDESPAQNRSDRWWQIYQPPYDPSLEFMPASSEAGWGMCGVDGDHQMMREAIAATYGMIEMIDDGVGQILAAIKRLDQTRDTIIVFTSDCGDMMGEQGLMMKGFMHYTGTLRVPMVIVDPQRTAGRTNSLSGSIDLSSTLLKLAGLAEFDGMQGTSLVPVLDDDLPTATAARAPIPAKTRTIVADRGRWDEVHPTQHRRGPVVRLAG